MGSQSAQPELAGEGDIALRETQRLDLVVQRARPDVRVVAQPDGEVLDEGSEPVARRRLALTGLALSFDIGADGLAVAAEVAGYRRHRPPPLDQGADLHVFLLCEHVLGLLL